MIEKGTGRKGLVLVFTGNGKGKTTAALGLAFRALGHGFPVSIIQFIKGSWEYGEKLAAKEFKDLLDFHVMGRGFTWKSDDIDKDIKLAREAWLFAKKTIMEAKHKLVILDELTYLVSYNMIEESEILELIDARPDGIDLVITGRGAGTLLQQAADMVTEMKEIKHHYKNGVKARKGIEY